MEAGGLLAYGPNRFAQYRHAAYFVDQILRGADPATLPVQHTAIELTLNARAARGLGLTLPADVLAQATDVLE